MTSESSTEGSGLDGRINRLATERTALFGRAGGSAGLSGPEHARLKTIERDLDECYALRRQQRAARTARRFSA